MFDVPPGAAGYPEVQSHGWPEGEAPGWGGGFIPPRTRGEGIVGDSLERTGMAEEREGL